MAHHVRDYPVTVGAATGARIALIGVGSAPGVRDRADADDTISAAEPHLAAGVGGEAHGVAVA